MSGIDDEEHYREWASQEGEREHIERVAEREFGGLDRATCRHGIPFRAPCVECEVASAPLKVRARTLLLAELGAKCLELLQACDDVTGRDAIYDWLRMRGAARSLGLLPDDDEGKA